MKLKFLLQFKLIIIFVFILSSCSEESTSPATNNNPNDLTQIGFNVNIISPEKNRDYSYHNNGIYGVFDDPSTSKFFSGKIVITNGWNSAENNNFIIKWTSDIDGVLFEGSPNESFQSEFTSNLSKGIHVITFEVYIEGHPETIKKDVIVISNVIKLETISQGNSVKLKWEKYAGEGFISYSIYREDFQPITQITNINQIEYIDDQLTDLLHKNKYQVIVTTQNNSNVLGSTISESSATLNLQLPGFVHKVIKGPTDNKIYAILSDGISGGNENFGVLIINPITMEIENHILKDKIFSDLDISYDGQNMYLTQKYIEDITIVNLNTLNVSSVHAPNAGWGYHKIEVTEGDYLICHQQPPTSGSSPIKLVNKNNGNTAIYLTHSHGDIEYNSKNNKLYAGESGSSNGFIFKATLEDDHLMPWDTVHFPQSLTIGVSYPYAFLFLSDDRDYIFWERYQLDLNMNPVRQFATRMKACSPNNLYLADESKVYNYNDLSEIYDFYMFEYDSENILFLDDHTLFVTTSIDNHFVDQPETTYFVKINLP